MTPSPSLRGGLLERAGQRVLAGLWTGLIPALLAGLVLRYLVPDSGSGLRGAVSLVGHRHGLYLGAALFLIFSLLARYWRCWLPGGRYCTALPAHLVPEERIGERLEEWAALATLYESLRSPRLRKHLELTVAPEALEAAARETATLRSALESADLNRAREARRAIESLAARTLAWRRRGDAVSFVATVAASVAAVLGLRAIVAQPYQVVGQSMLPTFEPGDVLLGNKVAYGPWSGRRPARGDVVVFPSDAVDMTSRTGLPEVLVKRVIGLPGDVISMHGNSPAINGWQVPSCDAGEYVYLVGDPSAGAFQSVRGRVEVEFLDDRAYLTVRPASRPSLNVVSDDYVVKADEVFVLGDNRGNSLDSRSFGGERFSGVPISSVGARAQWFVFGGHRNGDRDGSRFLRPVNALQTRLRLEGLDTRGLEDAVAQCFKNWPSETHPPREPPPVARTSARASGG